METGDNISECRSFCDDINEGIFDDDIEMSVLGHMAPQKGERPDLVLERLSDSQARLQEAVAHVEVPWVCKGMRAEAWISYARIGWCCSCRV